MHTTMVPYQGKSQKIQAGVQVSRLEDKDVNPHWKRLGCHVNMVVFVHEGTLSTRNLIQLDMVDSNGIQKELTAEPYEGDSEIAEAWFDQAAEYWKQAIALTPGNYIEALNWLKITRRFE
ncbi:hypothetical protein Tco_1121655 [Tanacetum coccineum]|uniref:Uncharacterized protein n=1 Tax=Tanacetum coccineum TaxID=301880 RepID=A0ABQ5IZU4_9ASTR